MDGIGAVAFRVDCAESAEEHDGEEEPEDEGEEDAGAAEEGGGVEGGEPIEGQGDGAEEGGGGEDEAVVPDADEEEDFEEEGEGKDEEEDAKKRNGDGRGPEKAAGDAGEEGKEKGEENEERKGTGEKSEIHAEETEKDEGEGGGGEERAGGRAGQAETGKETEGGMEGEEEGKDGVEHQAEVCGEVVGAHGEGEVGHGRNSGGEKVSHRDAETRRGGKRREGGEEIPRRGGVFWDRIYRIEGIFEEMFFRVLLAPGTVFLPSGGELHGLEGGPDGGRFCFAGGWGVGDNGGMKRFFHRVAPVLFLAVLAAAIGVQAWHADSCARAMDGRFLRFRRTEGEEKRFFVSPDAYAWLCHARDFSREAGWRKRWTTMDNVPEGRPVHWSQPLIWTLAGLSRAFRFAGKREGEALELAGVWAMPLFQFLCFGALGLWMARKRGWTAAAVFCALAAGAAPLRGAFDPLAPDHHGIQMAAMLACWAGLAFGRFGWVKADGTDLRETRWCFAFSGLSGAAACWIGGTAWLWEWACICFSALFAMRFCGGDGGKGRRMDAGAWRTWGWSGAAGSLLFWAVEYAPHAGMRLEVNHPLYALAFAGCGEVLRFLSLLRRDWGAEETSRRDRWAAAAGLAGLLALPACIALGPEAWFWPKNGLLRMLHAHFISEFQPVVMQPGWWQDLIGRLHGLALVPVWMLAVFAFERREPERTFLAALWGLVLAALALGFWMFRWETVLCGVLALAAAAMARQAAANRGWRRWLGAGFAVALLAWTGHDTAERLAAERRSAEGIEPIPAWGTAAAEKRLALAWAAEAEKRGEAEGMRWAGWLPAAPMVRYFTGAPSLGSYYWENLAGLEAEARFFADAPAGKEALAVAKERGLTHVACFLSPGPPFLHDSCRHLGFDTRRAERSLGGELAKQEPKVAGWIVPEDEWSRQIAGFVIQGPDETFAPFPVAWKVVRLHPEEALP